MDAATTAIIAPWAQYGIIGSVVLALGVVVVLQWKRINAVMDAHLEEVRECSRQNAELLTKKIESDNLLARALDGVSMAVRTKS